MPTVALRDITASVLAMAVTLTVCLIFGYETVNHEPYSVPDILTAGFFVITSFYLGAHSAANGARQAGVAAAQATAASTAQQLATVEDATRIP